ncbi:MAG: chromosome segregation protein [Trichococcus sp.]|nr:chromosome segregation protein [Trichococcus sp.]
MREQKKQTEQNRALQETEQNEKNKNLQKLWSEHAKLETNAGRYEIAIDHHLAHLSEEYGLSFEAAKQDHHLTQEPEEAARQVKKLKKDIEELGPINMGAIEEYDRISERFIFLSEQQTDLLSARGNLLNTMNEMDDEVRLRFKETFIQIKKQFEKTFPKLGGEKAFTAIALLFAIIEVKPVPFCILDEVEAALDEANVSRFGKYLAASTELTQFIVITHRKGTMEEADALYGVTMQDSGVSRLASVKFEDYEDIG